MIRCALKAHDSSRSRRVDTRNRALSEHRERPPSPWDAAPGYGIIAFQATQIETVNQVLVDSYHIWGAISSLVIIIPS